MKGNSHLSLLYVIVIIGLLLFNFIRPSGKSAYERGYEDGEDAIRAMYHDMSYVDIKLEGMEDGREETASDIYECLVSLGLPIKRYFASSEELLEASVTGKYPSRVSPIDADDEGFGYLNRTTGKYVLNRYSQVFHLPDCEYAQKINPENKEYSNSSRAILLSLGYSPCKWCNP